MDVTSLLTLNAGALRLQVHHQKHHQAYVTNFNAAMEQYAEAEAKGDVAKMIQLQPAIKFNGGGAFWYSSGAFFSKQKMVPSHVSPRPVRQVT